MITVLLRCIIQYANRYALHSVAQSSEQAPFTFRFVGSILATDSCEESQSTLCRNSWVFSGFLPQGKLTGWVRINTVKKERNITRDVAIGGGGGGGGGV